MEKSPVTDFDAETVWELPDTDAVRQHRVLNPFFTMPCGRYVLAGSGTFGNGVTLKYTGAPFTLYRIQGRQRDLFVVGK